MAGTKTGTKVVPKGSVVLSREEFGRLTGFQKARHVMGRGGYIAQRVDQSSGLVSAAIGGIIYFFSQSESIQKIEMFKKNWWLLGLIVTALGFILHRRGNAHGRTLMITGAIILVAAYRQHDAEVKAKEAQGGPPFETKGPTYTMSDGRVTQRDAANDFADTIFEDQRRAA